MPLFEYSCQSCDHTFEELVTANEKVECPECHGVKVKKLLSLPGLAQAKAGLSAGPCGDPSLPPCGAPWCQRKG